MERGIVINSVVRIINLSFERVGILDVNLGKLLSRAVVVILILNIPSRGIGSKDKKGFIRVGKKETKRTV